MTSAAKIRANRENARVSTGPKTASGRRRSAQNALRHGLSRSVYADPALAGAVKALAGEIAGPEANADVQELATRVAEAQLELRRVRTARHRLLSNRFNDPYYEPRKRTQGNARILSDLLSNHGCVLPIELLDEMVEQWVSKAPTGQQKLAIVLAQEVKQLLALERYEERALSRRKFAIRAVDHARRRREQKA